MMPYLVTSTERARDAAARWAEQYKDTRNPAHADITRQLLALTNPEPHIIEAIIGNKSWCEVRCDGCDWHGYGTIVVVGAPQDYESSTASLCEACAGLAKAAFEKLP